MSEKPKVFPDKVEISVGDALKDVVTGDFAGIAKAVKFDVSLPLGRAMGGVARVWRRVSGGEHPSVVEADASLAVAKSNMVSLFKEAQPVLLEMQRRGIADEETERVLTLVTDGNESGDFKFGRVGGNYYRELAFCTNAAQLSARAVDLRADPVWSEKLRSVEQVATQTLFAIEKAKDTEFRVAKLGLKDRLNRVTERADANSEEVAGLERSFKLVSNLVPSSVEGEPTMGEVEVAQFRRVTAYTTALNERIKHLMAPQPAVQNDIPGLAERVSGWKDEHPAPVVGSGIKPR